MYVEVCVRIRYPQCIRNVLDFLGGERGGKRGQLWWWQNMIKHVFFLLLSKQKRGEWEKESGEEYFVYSALWGYVVCVSLRCLDWIDVFDKGRKPNPNRSGWSWVNQSQACSFLSSSQKFCSGYLTGPHLPSRPAQSPNTNFVPLKTRGGKKERTNALPLPKMIMGCYLLKKRLLEAALFVQYMTRISRIFCTYLTILPHRWFAEVAIVLGVAVRLRRRAFVCKERFLIAWNSAARLQKVTVSECSGVQSS